MASVATQRISLQPGQHRADDYRMHVGRRHLIAVIPAGLTLLGLTWLRHVNLLAHTPILVILGSIVVGVCLATAASAWQRRCPGSPFRIHVVCASVVAVTTVVAYESGYGALVTVGYVLGGTQLLTEIPELRWATLFAWSAVAIACGEAGIALGIVPTLIDPRIAHVAAVVGVANLALVFWLFGSSLATRHRTEQQLRGREQLLAKLAATDPLTGLPNRRAFTDRLEAACGRGTAMLLAFVDLDGFKEINDEFGHQVGDAVLVEVGTRLSRLVRDCDIVARLGGDEFVILVDNATNRSESCAMLSRIEAALAGPCDGLGGLEVRASVGVVRDESGTRTADELLREADSAMYAQKRISPEPRRRVPSEVR